MNKDKIPGHPAQNRVLPPLALPNSFPFFPSHKLPYIFSVPSAWVFLLQRDYPLPAGRDVHCFNLPQNPWHLE